MNLLASIETIHNWHFKIEKNQIVEYLWILIQIGVDHFECFKTVLCFINFTIADHPEHLEDDLELHITIIDY